MNYRHSYHAGGKADVVKHLVLVLLIQALKQKEKGFCYVDSHAGRGMYDLTAAESKKTNESKTGIQQIYQQIQHSAFESYFNIIADLNQPTLIRYPGSPWIAHALLRPQDKMIINELHPQDYQALKLLLKYQARSENKSEQHPQCSIHHRDAYEFLPAVIPPELRRGLVLIDPPFERRDELSQLITVMSKCYQKWPEATYMLWLPLKDVSLTHFYQQLKRTINKEIFQLNCYWDDTGVEKGILGCNIAIINLPWQLERSIKDAVEILDF